MINNRKLRNWLEDGLAKGYDFYYLRDSLIDRGLKKEAEQLRNIFQKISKEAKSEKENNNNNNSQKRKKINSILLLSVFSLIVILFFVMNNSQFPWGGYIIYESENPGAIVNINFQDEVGVVRDDFYGANVHASWLRNGLYIDTNGDGTHETLANTTWHRQMFHDGGLRYAREDAGIDLCYYVNASNVSQWHRTCNLTNLLDEYAWAKANGVRILNILSYMPEGLRNITANCSTDPGKCEPLDYDVWGKIVTDYINATTLDGYYLDIVDYEVWNEPDLRQFLQPDLPAYTHGTQGSADIYVKLYNSSYTNIKATYPNAVIIGPTSAHIDIYTNITFSFLSNFANKMDGFSFHDFYPADDNDVMNRINNALKYCAIYHANYTRILMDEFNYKNISNIGGGMELSNLELSKYYADIFVDGLNLYPSNLSLLIYQWSDQYKYSDAAYYSEYPSRWSMVSEPKLDNALYASYNITKNFATYHSSGSTIVKSNSSSDSIKVVASKKGNSQYITVINTGEEVNIGLNLFGSEISQIKDLESGQIYDVEDNEVYIGAIDQYQIRYFVNSEGEESELLSYNPPLGNEEEEEDENSTLENESEEQCNNVSLNNQTCESLGYSSGVLSYNSQCELDTSNCINNSQSEENTHDNLNEEDTLSETNELDKNNNNGVKDKQKAFSFTNILYFSLVIGIFLLIFCVTKVLIKVKKYGTLKSHY